MRRGFVYIIGVAVIGLVVACAAEFSARSSTCMTCHGQEASFANWMATKLKTENRGFSHELIACADCHISGSPERTAMSRLRSLLHALTYFVPQIDPRQPQVSGLFNRTRVPTENCRYCHYASVFRKTVYLKDLPPELKKIGLAMDHRKHVLSREDTCARCHERFKGPDETLADKTVNYAEVNHLACDSCHSFASHYYRSGHLLPMAEQVYLEAKNDAWGRLMTNPRWMVAFPAETTCRRCHNGKIHYKTKIFESDCRTGANFENCLKCHPVMTREYFDEYLNKRPASAFKSDSNPNPSLRQETTRDQSDGKSLAEIPGRIVYREPRDAWPR
ncbi:MAG: hypothetical protein WCG29_08265 [Desulfomonile sp.]